MNNFDDSIDTAKNILYKGYNSTSMNMKLKSYARALDRVFVTQKLILYDFLKDCGGRISRIGR